jgi:hypothetical protein
MAHEEKGKPLARRRRLGGCRLAGAYDLVVSAQLSVTGDVDAMASPRVALDVLSGVPNSAILASPALGSLKRH